MILDRKKKDTKKESTWNGNWTMSKHILSFFVNEAYRDLFEDQATFFWQWERFQSFYSS